MRRQTFPDHELGDVLVTRGAAFRLAPEFRNEPYARQAYRSPRRLRRKHLAEARGLMAALAAHLDEPDFGPPTTRYGWEGDLLPGPHNTPDLKIDGDDVPEFHPILSADWFLFGTTTNGLEHDGCGVEMGDAVFGMVCDELGDGRRAGWSSATCRTRPSTGGCRTVPTPTSKVCGPASTTTPTATGRASTAPSPAGRWSHPER